MDKTQLYRYTGNAGQLYGARRVQIAEGCAAGAQVIEVKTGGGLTFDILPDTGLDIGALCYKGVNISYLSKNGMDARCAFLPYETEFIHTFPGGMLYTCGLRSVGPANRDNGEWHPLHGRYHGLPASEVSVQVGEDAITVSGVMTESALFGHVLKLRRTITAPLMAGSIVVEDTLENLTPRAEEIMLLYHFNFGYPMLDQAARLELPERTSVTPRDENAKRGLGRELGFTAPIDAEPEQVFFHTLPKHRARLVNPALGLAASLEWNGETLPVFAQWKSMASGDYVLGLEPSNCYIMGRNAEREHGTLRTLGGFSFIQTKLTLTLEELNA